MRCPARATTSVKYLSGLVCGILLGNVKRVLLTGIP
jgi:hypothetical protein